MMAYNKAFAGIASVLVARAIMHWFGVDLRVAGLSDDLQTLVLMVIVSAEAVWTGFWVWLIPNIKKVLHIDVDVKSDADGHGPETMVVTTTGQSGTASAPAGEGQTTITIDQGPAKK